MKKVSLRKALKLALKILADLLIVATILGVTGFVGYLMVVADKNPAPAAIVGSVLSFFWLAIRSGRARERAAKSGKKGSNSPSKERDTFEMTEGGPSTSVQLALSRKAEERAFLGSWDFTPRRGSDDLEDD